MTVFAQFSVGSCSEVKARDPAASNGLYNIKLSPSGTVVNAYCDMGGLFGAPALLVYQSHALPGESRDSESTGKLGSVSPTPSPTVTGLVKLSDAHIAEYRTSLRTNGVAAMNDLVSRALSDGSELGHGWVHPDCVFSSGVETAASSDSACLKLTLTSATNTDYITGTHAGWPVAFWSIASPSYGFITGHSNGRFYIGRGTSFTGSTDHGSNHPKYYCGTGTGSDACTQPASLEFWVQG